MRRWRASRVWMCRCLTLPISRSSPCRIRSRSSPPRAPSAIETRGQGMPTNILMPALSPTMTEGRLAKWLKKEGDDIKAGDVIAEIETDKATMEVEAVDEGKLQKIVVPAGTDGVPVNAPIAILLGEGEDPSAVAAPPPAPKPAAAAPKPAAAPAAPPQAAAPAAPPAPAVAPQPVQAATPQQKGERVFASPL